MSLADLDAYAMNAIAQGDTGSAILYARESGDWINGYAVVREVSEEESQRLVLGDSARRSGRRPLFVWISKTFVGEVDKGRDRLEWCEKTYTVVKVLDDQPGGWKLYCV